MVAENLGHQTVVSGFSAIILEETRNTGAV